MRFIIFLFSIFVAPLALGAEYVLIPFDAGDLSSVELRETGRPNHVKKKLTECGSGDLQGKVAHGHWLTPTEGKPRIFSALTVGAAPSKDTLYKDLKLINGTPCVEKIKGRDVSFRLYKFLK